MIDFRVKPNKSVKEIIELNNPEMVMGVRIINKRGEFVYELKLNTPELASTFPHGLDGLKMDADGFAIISSMDELKGPNGYPLYHPLPDPSRLSPWYKRILS